MSVLGTFNPLNANISLRDNFANASSDTELETLSHELYHHFQQMATPLGISIFCEYLQLLYGFNYCFENADKLKLPVSDDLKLFSGDENFSDVVNMYNNAISSIHKVTRLGKRNIGILKQLYHLSLDEIDIQIDVKKLCFIVNGLEVALTWDDFCEFSAYSGTAFSKDLWDINPNRSLNVLLSIERIKYNLPLLYLIKSNPELWDTPKGKSLAPIAYHNIVCMFTMLLPSDVAFSGYLQCLTVFENFPGTDPQFFLSGKNHKDIFEILSKLSMGYDWLKMLNVGALGLYQMQEFYKSNLFFYKILDPIIKKAQNVLFQIRARPDVLSGAPHFYMFEEDGSLKSSLYSNDFFNPEISTEYKYLNLYYFRYAKATADSNLSCFLLDTDTKLNTFENKMVQNCPFEKECRQSPKDSVLDFCKNEKWKEIILGEFEGEFVQ